MSEAHKCRLGGAASDPSPLETVMVDLTVNGKFHQIMIEPRMTLLDALREELSLTGTKKGCDRGECGACTVHIEGRRVLSCMTLAAMQGGRRITTIEGLEQNGKLHPLQEAFIDHGAFQCGYCTSGMLMNAYAFLQQNPKPTRDAIVDEMNGNYCRCSAYPRIIAAIADAGTKGGAR